MKTSLFSTSVMKQILTLLVVFFTYTAHAQNTEALISGLKIGNAAAVAKHFEANIELTLGKSSSAYSKTQAEAVLRNFFTKNSVKGFELKHQGTSPEGSKYLVGTLQTTSGNFSTYVYGKTANGIFLVRELRIEE